ncbi:hypothetical protein ACPYO6_08985 [Georgenia sp. Z1344]|uniref:hypothetical protein n=1 Tax=Georgenia sp. Z1344 TaxID=3416706 RepID=UPI003CF9C165
MIRRILAALLAVLGVTAIVLAVMSATTWKDEDHLTATLPERPGTPILTTDPGVLEMGADQVTITLTADPGEEIWYTITPTDRVTEWVGDGERTSVSGLLSRTELDSSTAGTESPVPHPGGSDMFRDAETATGEVEIEWTAEPGRHTLFAVVDGEADAPSITLSWPREVSTPYLVPGLIVGGVLLLTALALLLWPSRRRDVGVAGDGEGVAVPVSPEPAVDDDVAATRAESGAYAAAPAAGHPTTDPYAPSVDTSHGAEADGTDDDERGAAEDRSEAAGSDDRSGDRSRDRAEGAREAGTTASGGRGAAAAVAGSAAAGAGAALAGASRSAGGRSSSSPFAPKDDETEDIPVADPVDVSPEAVDAALSADMADLARREREGESLRRHERRVLAEARRETREDLRTGVDTPVRDELRSAGSARGAGILPYSPRADELRVAPGDDAAQAEETPTAPVEDQALADAEAARAAGRPLSRRERRALDRRARLGGPAGAADAPALGGDESSTATDASTPTGVGTTEQTTTDDPAAPGTDRAADGDDTTTPTPGHGRSTDDEWRDLWGFGPKDATENRR